jgi:hypothetical protein
MRLPALKWQVAAGGCVAATMVNRQSAVAVDTQEVPSAAVAAAHEAAHHS